MSDVLDLTCELIARTSVTPDDAGCQRLIAGRLQRAGFACESLRLGAVDNLWATHGSGAPVL
ncbi:succinyl-diaminopimelate desuccinylase, partial [Xanthomonas sp. Kuri4-3]